MIEPANTHQQAPRAAKSAYSNVRRGALKFFKPILEDALRNATLHRSHLNISISHPSRRSPALIDGSAGDFVEGLLGARRNAVRLVHQEIDDHQDNHRHTEYPANKILAHRSSPFRKRSGDEQVSGASRPPHTNRRSPMTRYRCADRNTRIQIMARRY